MKIINKTKKTVLSDHAFEAKSFSDKSLGLIDPNKPRSLIMNTRFGIHTLGMSEKIDVLILNEHNRVVKLKHNLKENTIFTWKPKYSRVIELPAGSITKSQTELGDVIQYEL